MSLTDLEKLQAELSSISFNEKVDWRKKAEEAEKRVVALEDKLRKFSAAIKGITSSLSLLCQLFILGMIS
jgi:hypothetical protein